MLKQEKQLQMKDSTSSTKHMAYWYNE